MKTRPVPAAFSAQTLSDAARILDRDQSDLERLIAEAVYVAETPSANSCVLPGAALEVEIEVGGTRLTARRESERASDWRLLLPN